MSGKKSPTRYECLKFRRPAIYFWLAFKKPTKCSKLHSKLRCPFELMENSFSLKEKYLDDLTPPPQPDFLMYKNSYTPIKRGCFLFSMEPPNPSFPFWWGLLGGGLVVHRQGPQLRVPWILSASLGGKKNEGSVLLGCRPLPVINGIIYIYCSLSLGGGKSNIF